jgi:hypothetical protein
MTLLLVATFLPDLLRLGFIPFGMWSFQSNTYTHALPWSGLVALAMAAIAWVVTRSRTAALVTGGLVLLHVVFDVVSGTKELWVGGPTGINLDATYWQYEFLIESALVIAGWWVMRPVAGSVGRSVRTVVALVCVEFLVLAHGVYQHPYRYRCWSYPFRACGEGGLLTRQWELRLPF